MKRCCSCCENKEAKFLELNLPFRLLLSRSTNLKGLGTIAMSLGLPVMELFEASMVMRFGNSLKFAAGKENRLFDMSRMLSSGALIRLMSP
jgi:hypothetical protein